MAARRSVSLMRSVEKAREAEVGAQSHAGSHHGLCQVGLTREVVFEERQSHPAVMQVCRLQSSLLLLGEGGADAQQAEDVLDCRVALWRVGEESVEAHGGVASAKENHQFIPIGGRGPIILYRIFRGLVGAWAYRDGTLVHPLHVRTIASHHLERHVDIGTGDDAALQMEGKSLLHNRGDEQQGRDEL